MNDEQEYLQANMDYLSEQRSVLRFLLYLESEFQKENYGGCAQILYNIKRFWPDYPEGWNQSGFLYDIRYNYGDRYRELVDFLTEVGYLYENADGSLSLPDELAQEYEDFSPKWSVLLPPPLFHKRSKRSNKSYYCR